MPTRQDNEDIQTLKTDVALIKAEQKTQSGTLKSMNGKLDNLAFVSQKDYDSDMFGEDGVIARIKAIEKYQKDNDPGVQSSNRVFSGLGKAIVAIVVATIIGVIVVFGKGLVPAAGGG